MDLAQVVAAAKPNETVQVPAGRYAVNLELTKPITLLAMGQVVLDGMHAGSVLRISTSGLVRLSGFMLVGGNAPEAGGAITLLGGHLELTDCTLRFNKAPLYGGGALYLRDASAVVTRCRFEGNTGRQGGAILVDGASELKLDDSTLIQNAAVDGGGLRVKEGAKVSLTGCTIADNKVVGEGSTGGAISLSGTTSRQPTLSLTHCIVSERTQTVPCIENGPKIPGTLTITRSLLPTWCQALGGAGNLFAEAGFVMSGNEPYLLSEKSRAVGAGSGISGKDVTGKERKGQDLGAFAFVGGGSSTLPY
jgi:hypothetical protein